MELSQYPQLAITCQQNNSMPPLGTFCKQNKCLSFSSTPSQQRALDDRRLEKLMKPRHRQKCTLLLNALAHILNTPPDVQTKPCSNQSLAT